MAVKDNLKTAASLLKIITLAVGTLTLVLGLYSHYESDWIKRQWQLYGQKPCQFWHPYSTRYCLNISLERYFISMVIISFVISVVSLVVSLFIREGVTAWKIMDLLLHGVLAILVLIAAIVYIVSAEEISNLKLTNGNHYFKYKRAEKLIAGSFTLLQGLLHAITAMCIARGKSGRVLPENEIYYATRASSRGRDKVNL